MVNCTRVQSRARMHIAYCIRILRKIAFLLIRRVASVTSAPYFIRASVRYLESRRPIAVCRAVCQKPEMDFGRRCPYVQPYRRLEWLFGPVAGHRTRSFRVNVRLALELPSRFSVSPLFRRIRRWRASSSLGSTPVNTRRTVSIR